MKQYNTADTYEKKLERVMNRLGVKDFNYDYSRHGAWVEFSYKDGFYRFDHTVLKAQNKGVKLSYGSDCFAQIVLSLEDLARMSERGIYELQTWIAGLKALPTTKNIEACFSALGFIEKPKSIEDLQKAYRELCKIRHPDVGGTAEAFNQLTAFYQEAQKIMEDA